MLVQDWRIEVIYEVRVTAACVLGVKIVGWKCGTLKSGIVLVIMLCPIWANDCTSKWLHKKRPILVFGALFRIQLIMLSEKCGQIVLKLLHCWVNATRKDLLFISHEYMSLLERWQWKLSSHKHNLWKFTCFSIWTALFGILLMKYWTWNLDTSISKMCPQPGTHCDSFFAYAYYIA